MTPISRLIGFLVVALLVGAGTLALTQRGFLAPEDPKEAGLRWLKKEYRLDEATFERVRQLHEEYYSKCDNMCREISAADRPLLNRMRAQSEPVTDDLAREQELCSECEKSTETHLRKVAELLPKEQQQHFLDDILGAVHRQRVAHDKALTILEKQP
jgi:hypothetical protein